MAKLNYIYFFDLLSHSEGRTYVGSTINIKKRFNEYRTNKENRFATNSIRKYGFDNFYKLVINLKDVTYKEMLLWEQFYIGLFGTYHKENENGMNLVRNPTKAISKDPLVAKKISDSKKGVKMSEENKEKIRLGTKGKIHLGVKRPYLSERNKLTKPMLGVIGENNPSSKKIFYGPENKIFNSRKELGDYLNLTAQAITYRMRIYPNDYKYI
jgi:hypothetical protein